MIIYWEKVGDEVLKWSFIILTGLYSVTLIHWIWFYPLGLSSPIEYLADLDVKMYSICTYVTPLLASALLSVRVFKPYIKKYLPNPPKKEMPVIYYKYLLIFSVLLAIFTAFYPYLPRVNPNCEFV
jgi:hypothetical protein